MDIFTTLEIINKGRKYSNTGRNTDKYIKNRYTELTNKGYNKYTAKDMINFELGIKYTSSTIAKEASKGACFAAGAEVGAGIGTAISPGLGTFTGAGVGGLGTMWACGKSIDYTTEKGIQKFSEFLWSSYKQPTKQTIDLSKLKTYISQGPLADSKGLFYKAMKPRDAVIEHPKNLKYFVDTRTGEYTSVPSNWQNYYNDPNNFKSMNIEKQLSIKNPVVEGVSNGNALLDQSELIVHQSLPTITPNRLAWLGQLGNILSTVGRLASSVIGVAGGFGGSASGVPTGVGESIVPYIDPNMPTIRPASMRHTGGIITPQPITNTLKSSQSHDEVLAILRGGETVRTEAQEQELQGEKYKELMNFIGPMLEDRDKKPKTIEEAYDPNNKVPCLLNKTAQGEELIISIIAQAWKSIKDFFNYIKNYGCYC